MIINPTARSGKAVKLWNKVERLLKRQNIQYEHAFTKKTDDAIDLAKSVSVKGYDVVVACGGDGTICDVITGILSADTRIKPALGVIHIGTSPDFNRHCGIPVDIDKAVDTLVSCNVKKIDIGQVKYFDLQNNERISYFGSSVNIGIGPYIANGANSRNRKYLGDFLGTLVSTIASLFKFKGSILKGEIDGRSIHFGNILNLTIGKDPYLASGMRVFNDIKPDDGRLYVLSIKKSSTINLLLNLHKLYIGDFLKYKEATINYCSDIKVESECDRTFIEFDGDMRGMVPAEVSVKNKALKVVAK